jgi:predicted O-methyltransferase YrrM
VIKDLHLDSHLEKYLRKNITETNAQKELREFSFHTLGNVANMQVTPEQASFLNFLIKIGNYSNVLELGTFMGYSTLSMALALNPDGKIITIDKDAKTAAYAIDFWKKAGVEQKIKLINEDAKVSLSKFINEGLLFDFIFIDADKSGYKTYFESCLSLITENGLIVFDNVLWKDKVANPEITDEKTEIIREFNNYIKNDNRVDTTMISIGDGMTLCKKKKNTT